MSQYATYGLIGLQEKLQAEMLQKVATEVLKWNKLISFSYKQLHWFSNSSNSNSSNNSSSRANCRLVSILRKENTSSNSSKIYLKLVRIPILIRENLFSRYPKSNATCRPSKQVAPRCRSWTQKSKELLSMADNLRHYKWCLNSNMPNMHCVISGSRQSQYSNW